MTEIVERLRGMQKADEAGEQYVYVRDIWKCAADEIERLRSLTRPPGTNWPNAYHEMKERLEAEIAALKAAMREGQE